MFLESGLYDFEIIQVFILLIGVHFDSAQWHILWICEWITQQKGIKNEEV
jgi:hypothetical protein